MTTQSVIRFLALATLASNALIILFFLAFLLRGITPLGKVWEKLRNFLSINSLKLSFLISSASTMGSLYLSEVAELEPCKLCWFQRIFIYPLVIILGVALVRKLKDVRNYVLPLTFIGGLIAIYHYFLQIYPKALAPCSATGFSASCSERFFTYFGYITIPLMSFSAFLMIFLLMLMGSNKKK